MFFNKKKVEVTKDSLLEKSADALGHLFNAIDELHDADDAIEEYLDEIVNRSANGEELIQQLAHDKLELEVAQANNVAIKDKLRLLVGLNEFATT